MNLCTNILIFKRKFDILIMFRKHAGIGEAVNTADCGSVMHGFESHISAHFIDLKHKIICFNID